MRRLLPALLLMLSATTTTASAQPSPKRHRVYPGQTLGGIAKRYNVGLDELCKANGLRRKDPIRPKQELIIPETPAEKLERERRDAAAKSAAAKTAAASKNASTKSATTTATTKSATAKSATAKSAAAKSATTKSATAKSTAAKSATTKSATATPASNATSSSAASRTSSGKPGPTRDEPKSFAQKPKRKGFIILSSTTGSWSGQALDKKGQVTTNARVGAAKVMASWRTGQKEDIHDRLIRLLVRVSDQFGGRPIRVVSGYRPYRPDQYTQHSKHNDGRAVDFFVLGVPNTVVRDFARTLPNVGVGYYPNSSFVHLDVREINSYWVDYSGPGEAPRYANSRGEDPGKPAPKPIPTSEAASEPEAESTDSPEPAPASGSADSRPGEADDKTKS
ncbi:MAG: DUF882 domain-containing protein [Polyangiaceae bacterium]|nr:DUF882 domain-containing protein [Polyangiaceae bacterium]